MRELIRIGVDGIITDRPDLLQMVSSQERADAGWPKKPFEVSGHRGARGLRPENTLPAFEAALDNLVDTIETDIGITADGFALLWHDQFLDLRCCRMQDGSPYDEQTRVYIRDLALTVVQRWFVCDKCPFATSQAADLSLSPVSVAFAAKEGLASPYVPIELGQLFRFVSFYAAYYSAGVGRSDPDAGHRAAAAENVGFNLEAKILPESVAAIGGPDWQGYENRTVPLPGFVDALCTAVVRHNMCDRARVLSFDFRALMLVQERYPEIPTCYLTEHPDLLLTEFVPEVLRIK